MTERIVIYRLMTQTTLFSTGIRPVIDEHLRELAQEKRDYGDYWSASSAGYCMRKVMYDRMKVPYTSEDDRKQRIFTAGHIFHAWIQGLTDDAKVSVAQEGELIDDTIMVKGNFDDLVFCDGDLLVYDYKTQNSRAFTWDKKSGRGMKYTHMMQVGTYLWMMRHNPEFQLKVVRILAARGIKISVPEVKDNLNEARILKISKDDLRMAEEQLMYTPELQEQVKGYWWKLNALWATGTLPECTCADHDGGFMAKEAYNPYFYDGKPCSAEWLEKCVAEETVTLPGEKV